MEQNLTRDLIRAWGEEPRYSESAVYKRSQMRHDSQKFVENFKRKYGIVIIAAALFVIYTICLSAIVEHQTEKRVRVDMAVEYASKLEAYKREQAENVQKEYFLSGEASRDTAINKEVDAVAAVISKLSTDTQKLTEASCMLARVMSSSYPNSFAEVASQAKQWMFYDGTDNTFSQHDRELADSIVRPYMEYGIVPDGLTADMVYGAWTPNDFVLRDTYQNSAMMKTWRHS